MKVRLYNFSKRNKSTKIPDSSVSYRLLDNVTLKETTSKTKPIFLFQTIDSGYNYLYVEEWARYYFISDVSSVDSMLLCLKERMENDDFPHEIGVFLGYDLSDIKAFIKGNACLYVGYWKVYSRVDEKIELFNKYTKCREIVNKMIDKGYPIENFMR